METEKVEKKDIEKKEEEEEEDDDEVTTDPQNPATGDVRTFHRNSRMLFIGQEKEEKEEEEGSYSWNKSS